jgi:hypothetical protein
LPCLAWIFPDEPFSVREISSPVILSDRRFALGQLVEKRFELAAAMQDADVGAEKGGTSGLSNHASSA